MLTLYNMSCRCAIALSGFVSSIQLNQYCFVLFACRAWLEALHFYSSAAPYRNFQVHAFQQVECILQSHSLHVGYSLPGDQFSVEDRPASFVGGIEAAPFILCRRIGVGKIEGL